MNKKIIFCVSLLLFVSLLSGSSVYGLNSKLETMELVQDNPFAEKPNELRMYLTDPPTEKCNLSYSGISFGGTITKETSYGAKQFKTSTGQIKITLDSTTITTVGADNNLQVVLCKKLLIGYKEVDDCNFTVNTSGGEHIFKGLDKDSCYFVYFYRPQMSADTVISGTIAKWN